MDETSESNAENSENVASKGQPPDVPDRPIFRSFEDLNRPALPVYGGIAGIVAWQLGRVIPGLNVAALLLLAFGGLGLWAGNRFFVARPRARSAIAWLGLASWLIPIAGAFTGMAVLGGQSGHPSRRERGLAYLTLLLSAGNILLGLLWRRPA